MKTLRCMALLSLVALSTTLHAETKTNAIAAAKPAEKATTGAVLATGKGFDVKQSEVDDAFIDYKANLAATRGQTIPEDQRSMIESNLLQRIIITKVLVNRATAADKTKAKEETAKLIDKAKKQFPSEEMFERQLKATGMTLELFEGRAYEQTLCEIVVESELKSKIKITDEQAKKFYDENPARFERPENVRVAHVLISTVDKDTQQPIDADKKKEKEKLAKDIKARAEKGEDFAKLAKEYSEDPGSKDKGGEYTFARGEMVPEFETAAFSLKTNQVSDVVETRYGYHVIKLLQKIPSEKLEFAKVLPDLKEGLVQQEAQKLAPDYFVKIKKEANVEIIGEKKSEKPAASPAEKPVAK